MVWGDQYLELLWVDDEQAARHNPLRLDRRSRWRTSGASPFGFGYRGQLPEELMSPAPTWVIALPLDGSPLRRGPQRS